MKNRIIIYKRIYFCDILSCIKIDLDLESDWYIKQSRTDLINIKYATR